MKQPIDFLVLICTFLIVSCQKSGNSNETPPQLNTSTTSITLNGNSTAIDSFTVNYSGKWTLSINPTTATWLKTSSTNGVGNTKVYVTIQESNTTGTNRTATIVVKPDENAAQAVNISITQNQYEFTPWRNVYGGTESDEFTAAIPTPDKGYIAVGSTLSNNGDVSANHGKKDVWVVKVDAEGKKQWQKTYGGSADENGNAIIATPDGGYIIVGRTASSDGDVTSKHGGEDVWLVKIDANGNKVWQKTYGGSSYEQAFSIIAASDGGYLVAAVTASTDGDVSGQHVTPGLTGAGDAWLFKIDDTGNLLWQKAYGGTNSEMAISVTKSADGGYVAIGYSNAYSADGDVMPTHGSLDFWAFKIDKSGSLQWQKAFGSTMVDFAWSIAATTDGSFIISGYTTSDDGDVTGLHGGKDAWIIKLNGSGNKVWQKTLGGSNDDVGHSVIPTPDGGCMVAGSTASVNGSGQYVSGDAWVTKLNSNGGIEWQKPFGGTGLDVANSIVATGSGTYLVTGTTNSNDGDIVGQHGKDDAWLIVF
ncbi:hypothetical protein OCK74_03550 [Chitinophagaceae bacterium LB-8]|uniref:BACON domain-containing protein n=1 Tax=Paraflavisolibacter caeni TaxID=2982496 RepID=A0A9X2XTA6_9BACT|nr:BACON domain-containing carbohydrate-binding protein [Paraflavisolibacter caeni]MCU7548170.1 hypothetical protein [Paraflavisolibacter caeni]